MLCVICNQKFKETSYLRTHMKLKHSGNEEFSDKAKYVSKKKSFNRVCTLCNRFFNSRNILNHMRLEHPEVSLGHICELCRKTFKNEWLLRRHIANVHVKERRFKCEICDKTWKRESHLTDHQKIHRQVILKCDKCDFQKLWERDLKCHKCRVRAFACDFCDHKALTKNALRMHIKRVHK